MLDEITITAIGGAGGNGAVSFRRERYVPRGGPDGGDGGQGGAVVLEADPSLLTLDGLRRKRTLRAEPGGSGQGKKRRGRDGKDAVVKVPVGTIVWRDMDGEEQLADMREPGAQVVVASGGLGGRGNARFATATRRVPRIAERGLPGDEVRLRLELRLLAEVGLVGLPNAGKSSLLRALSAARPKVGTYPFTTLEPHLGVVERGYERLVLADIPGLIVGAHEGVGLGVRFLQHVRRTRVLVMVVDGSSGHGAEDVHVVRRELKEFGHGLAEKRWLIALNKIDLIDSVAGATAPLRVFEVPIVPVSALVGTGVQELVETLFASVPQARRMEGAPRVVETLRPAAVRAFEVERVRGGFRVRGERPERAVLQLGAASDEARAELVRRLHRIGVTAALRRAGVAPGDRVRIGAVELEWPL
jgi:GTP-binding protein